MKSIATICLVLLSGAAAAAQPAPSCDRECLGSTATSYLYALLRHDTSKLPLADTLRVPEDGTEKPLAKLTILNTITSLRGYRQDILDERAGVAGTEVVVQESGAPPILVVRLKLVGGKITEIENSETN
jgi:hypothetical protein